MAHDNNVRFTSDSIDEQIEQYQAAHDAPAREISAVQTVQTLHRYYAPARDTHQSLERVWQRFAQHRASLQGARHTAPEAMHQLMEKGYDMQPASLRSRPANAALHRVAMIAAVVFVTLLVGSMVAVFQLARHGNTTGSQPGSGTTTNVDAGEIYATANEVVYRLDPATYKPLWHFQMHPLGGNNYTQYSGQAVNHIYYFLGTGTDSYYFYALNTADGTLRWRLRLPDSAQLGFTGNQLIVRGVVYLSEASITDGYSLVIALNASTGHIMWQHRYDNTGIALGEKHSTDFATGLQLEAATSSQLYGASSTIKNGKGTLSLFALSPKDGSVVWQRNGPTKEQVAGVQIANDILFITTWYSQGSGNEIGYLNAYATATGVPIWRASLNGQPDNFAIFNGRVYISVIYSPGAASRVSVLDSRNGRVLYLQILAGGTSPVAIEQGIFYCIDVGKGKQELIIVAADGVITGKSLSHAVSLNAPPVVYGNFFYLSESATKVDILRATDGKLLRTFTLGKAMNPPIYDYVQLTIIG